MEAPPSPDPYMADGRRRTPVQVEAGDWMQKRERNPKFKGGYLCDTMGLGKTLNVLYLVASNQAQGPTLICCPKQLCDTWMREPTKLLRPGTLKMHLYEGNTAVLANLGKRDVVITPHSRLSADMKNHLKQRADEEDQDRQAAIWQELLLGKSFRRSDREKLLGKPPYWGNNVDKDLWTINSPLAEEGLYSIHWGRLVFDEAHMVRNSEAMVWKAAMCLSGEFRWMVTGTPLQNAVKDITSGMLFLRVPGVCREDGPMARKKDPKMSDQDCRADHEFPNWSFGRTVQQLVETRKEMLEQTPELRFLVENTKHIFEHAVQFRHEEERKAHDNAVRRLKRVAQILAERSEDPNRKRYLVTPLATEEGAGGDNIDRQVAKEVDDLLASGKKENDVLLVFYTRARQICIDLTMAGEPPLQPLGTLSTKMQVLVEDAAKLPEDVCFLVFAPWVQALTRASAALTQHLGITNRIIHGGLDIEERNSVIRDFQSPNSKTRALLLQINLAGVGLTLTRASVTFFLTCEFNPGVEDQAEARLWRTGQTRDVVIKRLMISGSVEELVLDTSTKKRRLAESMRSGMDSGSATAAERLPGGAELFRGLTSYLTTQYRERDQETDYREGIKKRARFEHPQEQPKVQPDDLFLAPWESWTAARFVPAGSLMWRLSTPYRDIADYNSHKVMTGGQEKTAAEHRLSVALDVFRLRKWLQQSFFKSMEIWEYNDGLAHDRFSNADSLIAVATDQIKTIGYTTVAPKGANTPSDWLRVTSVCERPRLIVYRADQVITQQEGCVVGEGIDARQQKSELFQMRGKLAAKLRSPQLRPFLLVDLNVETLACFEPLLVGKPSKRKKPVPGEPPEVVSNMLPQAEQVYPGNMVDPSRFWRKINQPLPVGFDTEDCSRQDHFCEDVQHLLLPYLQQQPAEEPDMNGQVTALLCILLCTAAPSERFFRVLLVHRDPSSNGRISWAGAVLMGKPHCHTAMFHPCVYSHDKNLYSRMLGALLNKLREVAHFPEREKGAWYCPRVLASKSFLPTMLGISGWRFMQANKPEFSGNANSDDIHWCQETQTYVLGTLYSSG
jgi:hypothetical protein